MSGNKTEEVRFCEHCKTTKTPIWRKGWKKETGKKVTLCNKCGLHFQKGHYCSYCFKIYPSNFHFDDEHVEELVECSKCSKYDHKQCLKEKGMNFSKNYECQKCKNEKITELDSNTKINWNFCSEQTISNPVKIQKTKKIQNIKLPSISHVLPDIEECEKSVRKKCSTCVYSIGSLPPINCIMNNKCSFY
eukprot:gene4224-7561_t